MFNRAAQTFRLAAHGIIQAFLKGQSSDIYFFRHIDAEALILNRI